MLADGDRDLEAQRVEPARQALQILAQRHVTVEYLHRETVNLRARGGELETPADALEQRHAVALLERAQTLAHRGLADVQLAGGFGDAALSTTARSAVQPSRSGKNEYSIKEYLYK